MYLTTALTGLMLAAPALAATQQQQPTLQKGKLGFSLGAVLPGPNGEAVSKTTQDYMDDFKAIKASTDARVVRLYAASQNDQAANVLPAAAEMGFQVVLGVWVNNATNPMIDDDVTAIVDVAKKYSDTIYGVTIGSEGLYRGNYSASDLAGMIEKFSSTPGIKGVVSRIGTADTWNALTDGRGDAIIQSDSVNLILANAFAFWQNDGTHINNASYCYHDDVQQSIGHVQQLRGNLNDIEYWVGETGWPSAGGGYGDESSLNDANPANRHYSEASVDNAQTFFSDGVCPVLAYGINVFVFEAFDEPLKADATGLNGQVLQEKYWGVMDQSRKPKYSLSCD